MGHKAHVHWGTSDPSTDQAVRCRPASPLPRAWNLLHWEQRCDLLGIQHYSRASGSTTVEKNRLMAWEYGLLCWTLVKIRCCQNRDMAERDRDEAGKED